MCRFDLSCSRRGKCKFRHSDDVSTLIAIIVSVILSIQPEPQGEAAESSPLPSPEPPVAAAKPAEIETWLPFQLRLSRGPDEALVVEESLEDPDVHRMPDIPGSSVYDLMAVVAHIHNPSCQNLVTHVKVLCALSGFMLRTHAWRLHRRIT